jgi:hypothetical protein
MLKEGNRERKLIYLTENGIQRHEDIEGSLAVLRGAQRKRWVLKAQFHVQLI